jgi:muskelin
MSESSTSIWPSPRGGHQLIWDSNSQRLFLLGGWDGKKDLGDFWSFDPISSSWTLLSMNAEKEGGPSPRSCHKAVLHSDSANIYVLGRYIDPERRDSNSVPCDFYRYSLESGQWTRLSADVRAEGGPGCIYDHQMIVDEEEECIWVFGGRLLCGTNESSVYSGLYKFDLKTLQWFLINSDSSDAATSSANVSSFGSGTNTLSSYTQNTTSTLPPMKIPSRIGHSMLFDPQSRSLLILGGQRYKDQLSDFYKYSIDRNCVSQLWKNLQMVGGPDSGFTQRASIDQSTRELFVFSSLIRGNNSSISTPAPAVGVTPPELQDQNTDDSVTADDNCTFWCFDLIEDKWTKIKTNSSSKPPARFAHQIVYNPLTQTHFLFGGNPGIPSEPSARFDDLWEAKMSKSQGPEDILRHCQYLIRKAMFEAMTVTGGDIPSALKFLQNDLAAVVDHSDPSESASFRSLSAKLFLKSGKYEEGPSIFDEIIKYFPKSMQPPINNL